MDGLFDQVRIGAHAVWRRRWLALGVAWGVCLLGWMAVAMIPNKYESKARIFVELDDVLSDQLKIANGGKGEIDRVRKTLAGGVNLEKVIRGTDLGADVATPREMEQTVANLAENVKVESQEDSLFTITALIGKPSLSDEIAALAGKDQIDDELAEMKRALGLSDQDDTKEG